jgi:hypothetical protein
MSESATGFPVDDATLVMLAASCRAANFDDGRSHLHDFLAMGEAEPIRKTLIDDADGVPIYEVEHASGEEPFSVADVIEALIAEIQRLREAI